MISTKALITAGRTLFLRTLTLPTHSSSKYYLKSFCSMASGEDLLAPLRVAVKEQVMSIPCSEKSRILCLVLGRHCKTVKGRKAAKDGDQRGSS